jgi:hypothetical protein
VQRTRMAAEQLIHDLDETASWSNDSVQKRIREELILARLIEVAVAWLVEFNPLDVDGSDDIYGTDPEVLTKGVSHAWMEFEDFDTLPEAARVAAKKCLSENPYEK